MNKRKVLIADDDREIVDLIELYLAGEDYEIIKAYDGKECMEMLKQHEISLLVLDVMMPRIDGLEVCKNLRETSNIPVILVSARTAPIDKVQGLSGGADDYITKPFHPLELVARIKAQMRRYTELNPNRRNEPREIIIKDLVINMDEHTVQKGEELCQLTPKEFDILLLLAQNRGQVFSSETIFEKIWKESAFDQDNTVMVHVRKLRDKLGDNARRPKYIHTVWGVGYKIEK
ncbi:MAG: response regulator transcription factor [Roseburia sp.]|nr:response regulator transcription factor [Roseburia sp.]MCM1096638.1 response regulator transcription factor [Ruminococcus flavefaciens]MCM1223537.1 response regulator transcription factor [Lachnospiraceae bacterium]MCM1234663.1 response regulator transcription factor [Ruminococcus flavefaciens]